MLKTTISILFLANPLVDPIKRKIGTTVGTWIAAIGYTNDIAAVEAAVAFLAGVIFDTLLSNLKRRGQRRKIEDAAEYGKEFVGHTNGVNYIKNIVREVL